MDSLTAEWKVALTVVQLDAVKVSKLAVNSAECLADLMALLKAVLLAGQLVGKLVEEMVVEWVVKWVVGSEV
jgi:hypothetical protein